MSTQTEVQQVKKPLLGWKSKVWLFVICFFVGNIILPLIWKSDTWKSYGLIDGDIINEGVRVAFLLFSLWLASYLIKRGTNPFWTLVRNDMQSVFRWKSVWGMLVIALCTALLVVKYGYFPAAYQEYSAVIVISFIPFGLGYYATKKEWQNKTAGWWLTLPYSKKQLISSKIIAVVIHLFSIYMLAILLSYIIHSVLPHYWENSSYTLLNYLGRLYTGWIFEVGIIWLLAGIVVALLSESVFKKYLFLFFISLPILSFILIFGYRSLVSAVSPYLLGSHPHDPSHVVTLGYIWMNVGFMSVTLFTFLSCWLLAYLLYRCAVYVCEKKIEA